MSDGPAYMIEAPHCTDLGNARRFAIQHGHDLLFSYPLRRWFVWVGTHWAEDQTGEVIRRAKRTVLSIYEEARICTDERWRKELAKHAARSESEARVLAMISLAESEPGIQVLPYELDKDPWLLNVQNGTLDLKTAELRHHNKLDLMTKCLPVAYDPEALCPTWLAFLERIFDSNPRLIEFVKRSIGYSLTGDTSEQCLFVCHGSGENGKSTQIQTILGLWSDYARKTPTKTLMVRHGDNIPNDIARLRGARFVAAVEGDEGKRLAESLVKEITGQDTVSARFMRAEFFEFIPEFKLWLATNHKPRILGTDRAIWRRIRLIPYNVTIPRGEQDRHLRDRLKLEWPGILAWAVRGCLAWQRHGLDPPEEVVQATEAYRAEQDLIGAFVDDCCCRDEFSSSRAKDLYAAFQRWCESNGERPATQREFGQRLSERGFTRERGTANVHLWRGIALNGEGQ